MKLAGPATVAVILSTADLKRAINMRIRPDYFELRLDALAPDIPVLRRTVEKLRAPIIITARHPAEGGHNALSTRARRELLREFLPRAALVDVELRASRAMGDVLKEARTRSIGTIISIHRLNGTPAAKQLAKSAHAARRLKPDVLKVATRTDNPMQFATLRDFLSKQRNKGRIAVMGIGRLGRRFREEFARESVLNYGHLGKIRPEGQLSITALRRLLGNKGRSRVNLPIRLREYA